MIYADIEKLESFRHQCDLGLAALNIMDKLFKTPIEDLKN